MAFDGAGNLAIDDEQNFRVRFVSARTESQYGQAMSTGDIYTIAGNGKNEYGGEGLAATGGGISQPLAVALDSAGDLDHRRNGALAASAHRSEELGQLLRRGTHRR